MNGEKRKLKYQKYFCDTCGTEVFISIVYPLPDFVKCPNCEDEMREDGILVKGGNSYDIE